MNTQHQHPQTPQQDNVFDIEYNYRGKAKVKRSRLIRQMRRQEAYPNGRKPYKRIHKYRPIYGFNAYRPDQPWDVLVSQDPPQHEDSMESIEVEKQVMLRSDTNASLKEMQGMSRQTICEARPCGPLLYLQAFIPFEFPLLE